jgi:hypothetical protein
MKYRLTGRGLELAEVAPSHCPNGHRLGPGQVLIGTLPCWCAGAAGHRTYWCRDCQAVIFDPPHNLGAEQVIGYSR